MNERIYHLHALSGLHVGTGQGIGVIDMPIARERASNLPLVPGSGIKGVLRDECKGSKDIESSDYLALFGPEATDNASEFAGALAISDARLLCLPVRSWKGTFAWVTCPMILHRYQQDTGKDTPISEPQENQGMHTSNTVLIEENEIYLEDLDIKSTKSEEVDDWASNIANQLFAGKSKWQDQFKQRFLIVHNDIFDFLSETATEIRARIKIKEETRTVQQGALWYEEYLPAETVLWGVLAADDSRNKDSNKKTASDLLSLLPKSDTRIQLGGNATVGAGQVRWIMGGE